MSKPRVLLLRAPGTNCDQETARAFVDAGADADVKHANELLGDASLLDSYQILCFPGGFSYGDDIAAGRILGNQIRLRLADACQRFKQADKLVLGICNGFQILLKTGLLDIDDSAGPQATLTWNDSGRYEARWVDMAATPGDCVFLRNADQLQLPVAHAEGKFLVRDQSTFDHLHGEGRFVLRYDTGGTGEAAAYPANPNGSMGHVAGICDSSGRVLGMMPHPERFVDATQHPQWTRDRWTRGERAEKSDAPDGRLIFRNAVDYFA